MDEWIQNNGAACYNSPTEGYALSQSGILIPGMLYSIDVSVSNMTQGKLIIDSLIDKPEITINGSYSLIGIASISDLNLIGGKIGISIFDGCVSALQVRAIPLYQIKDPHDNIIFTQIDETGVSASINNIQYLINWSDIAAGCYKITFTDGIINYESDLFSVDTEHTCSIQLTWSNNENAYGFDFETLLFRPSLRIVGKKWQPFYQKDKEVFKDSIGNRTIIRSDTSKIELLTINEAPEYIHDAISIGIEHDDFEIDSIQYVVEDQQYLPKWRKSSSLASSETQVIKNNQNLVNENCA